MTVASQRVVGVFVEFFDHLAVDSVFEAPGEVDYPRELVVDYLQRGAKVGSSMSARPDPFNSAELIVGAGAPWTDGQWIWPQELTYLVRHYGVALPSDFLVAIASSEGKPPVVSADAVRAAWETWQMTLGFAAS